MSTVTWPDLSPYGLTLRVERWPGGRHDAVLEAVDEGMAAMSAVVIEAQGFVEDSERATRWTRDAGLSPRDLARAFPLMVMRNTPIADVVMERLEHPGASDALDREGEVDVFEEADTREESNQEKTSARGRGTRIEDFGEHIGGAKKERWSRARGIRVEDVAAWTREERASLLTKDRVWPKPDWIARLDEGADIGVLYRIKRIRDGLHAFPGIEGPRYARRRTRSLRPDAAREEGYVTTVGMLADRLAGVRTAEDAREAFSHYLNTTILDNAGGRPSRRLAMTPMGDAVGKHQNQWKHGNAVYDLFDPADFAFDTAAAARANWPCASKKIRHREQVEQREVPRKPLDHIQRVGGAEGLDRDVTPEDFLVTFGFRGGEFGNWVSQAERQASLNHGYAALLDLAAVMDMPPSGVSLNGSLAIAFGARGSGHFAAHYEPGRRVINLTKPSGAGALAHEWAHALDHFLATETGNAEDFRRPYASPFGATQMMTRRSTIGADVVAAVDTFAAGMVRRPMSIEEIDQRCVAHWKSAFKRAGDWAKWTVSVAQYQLYNAATLRTGSCDAVGRERLRTEIAQSAPILRLQALADVVQSDRSWARNRVEAESLSLELERAFVSVVGGRHERKNRGYAVKAIQAMPAFPETPSLNARLAESSITQTSYMRASIAWDAGRSKTNLYYSTPWEMFARAFETCVNDALEERGWRNDYLVHSTYCGAWEGHKNGNPYPAGEDLAVLREAFKHLSHDVGGFLVTSNAQCDLVAEPRAAVMSPY